MSACDHRFTECGHDRDEDGICRGKPNVKVVVPVGAVSPEILDRLTTTLMEVMPAEGETRAVAELAILEIIQIAREQARDWYDLGLTDVGPLMDFASALEGTL